MRRFVKRVPIVINARQSYNNNNTMHFSKKKKCLIVIVLPQQLNSHFASGKNPRNAFQCILHDTDFHNTSAQGVADALLPCTYIYIYIVILRVHNII